jgi:uncharacterized membrane protein YphA (DoxX/SURF4 family)
MLAPDAAKAKRIRAVMYCFAFLYFVFAGAGSWSLDALLWRTRIQNW